MAVALVDFEANPKTGGTYPTPATLSSQGKQFAENRMRKTLLAYRKTRLEKRKIAARRFTHTDIKSRSIRSGQSLPLDKNSSTTHNHTGG